MNSRTLRDAFGAFPTGVVAVAAQVDGRPVGLAASSFTSVSLDPPLASFSVAKGSTTWPDLRRAKHLGVTVLAEDHGALCRQLAGPAQERFTGVAFEITDRGAVMLAEGIAQYDCTVREELEAGDHVIVLLQLHAVVVHSCRQPLIFHRSEFGRLAPQTGTHDSPLARAHELEVDVLGGLLAGGKAVLDCRPVRSKPLRALRYLWKV